MSLTKPRGRRILPGFGFHRPGQRGVDTSITLTTENPKDIITEDGNARLIKEAVSAYTGPLDLISGPAYVTFGHRAMSAASRGTALYTLRTTLDDSQQSFDSDATTGACPASAITAFKGSPLSKTGEVTVDLDTITLTNGTGVFIGQTVTGTDIPANTRVVNIDALPVVQISNPATGSNAAEALTFTQQALLTIWNDQSGNDFDLNSEDIAKSSEARWVASGLNSLPVFIADANALYSGYEFEITVPMGYSVFVVTRGDLDFQLSNPDTGDFMEGDCSPDGKIYGQGGGGLTDIGWLGTSGLSAATYAVYDLALSDTVHSYKVNGVEVGHDFFSDGVVGTLDLESVLANFITYAGTTCSPVEMLVCPIQSNGVRDAVVADMAAYYGITLA